MAFQFKITGRQWQCTLTITQKKNYKYFISQNVLVLALEWIMTFSINDKQEVKMMHTVFLTKAFFIVVEGKMLTFLIIYFWI